VDQYEKSGSSIRGPAAKFLQPLVKELTLKDHFPIYIGYE